MYGAHGTCGSDSSEILQFLDDFEIKKENPIENFDWIEIDTNPARGIELCIDLIELETFDKYKMRIGFWAALKL